MEYFLHLGAFILIWPFIVFCWHSWTFSAYKQYKSQHMEANMLLKVIIGIFTKHSVDTREVFQEIINHCRKFQGEGVSVIWFFRPYLFIYGEEFSKRFFNEKAAVERPFVYSLSREFFGNGLSTSTGEVWKVHRKLINPVFRLGVLKGKMHIFNESGIQLVEKLLEVEGMETEELLKILKRHTFRVMAESILGLKLDDEKYDSKIVDFLEMCDKGSEIFVKRISRPWLYWKFLLPFFSSGRDYLECEKVVHSFTPEIVEDIKKTVTLAKTADDLDTEVENRKSFGYILLEQHLKDPTLTIEDVKDHVNTFMAGGYDTISHALMWCLYLLGHHPEVQEKAFEEATTVEGKDVTYEDVYNLRYLECVLKETLRLYPVLPIYGRKLTEDVQCGKYTVPKGAELAFFPFMLHRNPEVFPDPEKFDPERFSGNAEIRPWMFTPFAEGYRACIGKNYALMAGKVTLVHILRRYEITTLNKIEDTELDWTITLKPSKPIRMLLKDRRNK